MLFRTIKQRRLLERLVQAFEHHIVHVRRSADRTYIHVMDQWGFNLQCKLEHAHTAAASSAGVTGSGSSE